MADNIKSSGTRILLIRHGETEWNRTHKFQGRSDVPLNQKGKDQGHALTLALKDGAITAIYSSPLTRALGERIPGSRPTSHDSTLPAPPEKSYLYRNYEGQEAGGAGRNQKGP